MKDFNQRILSTHIAAATDVYSFVAFVIVSNYQLRWSVLFDYRTCYRYFIRWSLWAMRHEGTLVFFRHFLWCVSFCILDVRKYSSMNLLRVAEVLKEKSSFRVSLGGYSEMRLPSNKNVGILYCVLILSQYHSPTCNNLVFYYSLELEPPPSGLPPLRE